MEYGFWSSRPARWFWRRPGIKVVLPGGKKVDPICPLRDSLTMWEFRAMEAGGFDLYVGVDLWKAFV